MVLGGVQIETNAGKTFLEMSSWDIALEEIVNYPATSIKGRTAILRGWGLMQAQAAQRRFWFSAAQAPKELYG